MMDTETNPMDTDLPADDALATARIAQQIGALHKTARGRGPGTVRVHRAGDLVVVELRDGTLPVEHTLRGGGMAGAVHAQRQEYERSMQRHLTAIVQEATGRPVVAFMSAGHHEPDVVVEIFVLAAEARQPE